MRWVVFMLALLSASLTLAEDPEYRFLGPPPARNFQPIQLIFLQLPFERAATVERGEISLLLNSAESNEIATSASRVTASLKFETNRTVFGARYGLAPHWEIGLDLPFITRYGGFLDPIIDEVEYIFGSGNPERDIYPNNKFGEFAVARNGTVLFKAGTEAFQPGDLWFSVKREIPLPDPWPLLALRGAVKAPTGDVDAVLGSGTTDLGFGLAAEHHPLRRLMLYGNLGLVYPLGRVTAADLTLNPIFSESFAAELALTHRVSALLHQAVYTSPFHGTGARLLDGTVVELGLALGFAWKEWLGFQLLGINNVSGVEQAADFSLLLAITARGWQVPSLSAAPPPVALPPLAGERVPPPPAPAPPPAEAAPPPVEQPEPVPPELPPLEENLDLESAPPPS
jgi:Protein of unknown function (DUF3187)